MQLFVIKKTIEVDTEKTSFPCLYVYMFHNYVIIHFQYREINGKSEIMIRVIRAYPII